MIVAEVFELLEHNLDELDHLFSNLLLVNSMNHEVGSCRLRIIEVNFKDEIHVVLRLFHSFIVRRLGRMVGFLEHRKVRKVVPRKVRKVGKAIYRLSGQPKHFGPTGPV
jgi:hypothetical protein